MSSPFALSRAFLHLSPSLFAGSGHGQHCPAVHVQTRHGPGSPATAADLRGGTTLRGWGRDGRGAQVSLLWDQTTKSKI